MAWLHAMPVTVSFEQPDLFILRAYGPVTYVEVLGAIDRLLADSRLGPGTGIFIDNRGVTTTPTIAEVASIASHFQDVFTRGATRLALLSDSEQVHEVARMFAAFASTVGAVARGFRDARQAMEWLGTDS